MLAKPHTRALCMSWCSRASPAGSVDGSSADQCLTLRCLACLSAGYIVLLAVVAIVQSQQAVRVWWRWRWGPWGAAEARPWLCTIEMALLKLLLMSLAVCCAGLLQQANRHAVVCVTAAAQPVAGVRPACRLLLLVEGDRVHCFALPLHGAQRQQLMLCGSGATCKSGPMLARGVSPFGCVTAFARVETAQVYARGRWLWCGMTESPVC